MVDQRGHWIPHGEALEHLAREAPAFLEMLKREAEQRAAEEAKEDA